MGADDEILRLFGVNEEPSRAPVDAPAPAESAAPSVRTSPAIEVPAAGKENAALLHKEQSREGGETRVEDAASGVPALVKRQLADHPALPPCPPAAKRRKLPATLQGTNTKGVRQSNWRPKPSLPGKAPSKEARQLPRGLPVPGAAPNDNKQSTLQQCLHDKYFALKFEAPDKAQRAAAIPDCFSSVQQYKACWTAAIVEEVNLRSSLSLEKYSPGKTIYIQMMVMVQAIGAGKAVLGGEEAHGRRGGAAKGVPGRQGALLRQCRTQEPPGQVVQPGQVCGAQGCAALSEHQRCQQGRLPGCNSLLCCLDDCILMPSELCTMIWGHIYCICHAQDA